MRLSLRKYLWAVETTKDIYQRMRTEPVYFDYPGDQCKARIMPNPDKPDEMGPCFIKFYGQKEYSVRYDNKQLTDVLITGHSESSPYRR